MIRGLQYSIVPVLPGMRKPGTFVVSDVWNVQSTRSNLPGYISSPRSFYLGQISLDFEFEIVHKKNYSIPVLLYILYQDIIPLHDSFCSSFLSCLVQNITRGSRSNACMYCRGSKMDPWWILYTSNPKNYLWFKASHRSCIGLMYGAKRSLSMQKEVICFGILYIDNYEFYLSFLKIFA